MSSLFILDHCTFTDNIQDVLLAMNNTKLADIDISYIDIGTKLIDTIVSFPHDNLVRLNISGIKAQPQALKTLVKALKLTNNFTQLIACNTHIGKVIVINVYL